MGFFDFFRSSKAISDEWFDALEELLIESDFGSTLSIDLVKKLKLKKWDKNTSIEDIKKNLAQLIEENLSPFISHFDNDFKGVILLVGVNGSGKTTTIPKLINYFKSCSVVAGDTFRAAAVDQIKLWGEKLNAKVYSKENVDSSALVFEAIKSFDTKVLIIDTAGRLQTQNNLMDELLKIKKTIIKAAPQTPLEIILILDGTVGQNALSQVEKFHNLLSLTGLVMTKMDGTSKGGVILNTLMTYKVPIKGITFGETIDKFSALDPKQFTKKIIDNSIKE